DDDLLTMTRQYVVKNEMGDVKRGIDLIKKIFAVQKIVLAVPDNMVAEARAAGVEVEGVDMSYPAANPRMIAVKIAGQPIPAGTSCEEAGIFFVSAEAVASVARAYEARQIPQQKVITVIRKDGERSLVSALIGTPVGHVLEACSQEVSEGDRIVFGGPMKGMAVYTEAYPVRPDTDAIMVQDAGDIPGVSDRACVNCGECVRVCPARLPVNVLVRYLEAGEYAEAVDRCDLQSCIECGLCAFVCPARIPVFQYIKLGKYEFARLNAAEAENA
ncbi:MAG: 4Fe-4S dicluster domain-containing protein, partial [Desulfosudaceae bacterium]